ncbi:hypothetical protein [Pontibacter russatus]|uniref:hypothetical protein n=1 Tax=Pontibacter russatus TaxID=2694929 RepID=UPI00137B2B08|nr:hypothetical protein [Pontibacter russatus]
MKIVMLLLAVFACLCFACKKTPDQSTLVAQRQQLLATGAPVQETPSHPLAMNSI